MLNLASANSVNLAATLNVQQHTQVQSTPISAYAGFQAAAVQSSTTISTEKKAEAKGGRPVNSTPVPGSPWCVVWTSKILDIVTLLILFILADNKVFFYNPSTKTSVWDRPPELYNRPDVDSLVVKPPDANGTSSAVKRSFSENESDEDGDSKMVGAGDGEESEQDEEDTSAPATKKSRKEKKKERQLEEQKREMERKIEAKKQQPKVEKPLDPAIAAELAAQEERTKVGLIFEFWK